jgi:hypothetical protein
MDRRLFSVLLNFLLAIGNLVMANTEGLGSSFNIWVSGFCACSGLFSLIQMIKDR